jgi:hypothetical protein
MRRRLPLHNQNAPRYFDAMNRWFVQITGKNLDYHARELNQKLSPMLMPLAAAS